MFSYSEQKKNKKKPSEVVHSATADADMGLWQSSLGSLGDASLFLGIQR